VVLRNIVTFKRNPAEDRVNAYLQPEGSVRPGMKIDCSSLPVVLVRPEEEHISSVEVHRKDQKRLKVASRVGKKTIVWEGEELG
jgi:hypothetical protein